MKTSIAAAASKEKRKSAVKRSDSPETAPFQEVAAAVKEANRKITSR